MKNDGWKNIFRLGWHVFRGHVNLQGNKLTKQTIESLGKANLSMTLSDWKDIRNFEVSKKMPHNRFVATVKRMKGSFLVGIIHPGKLTCPPKKDRLNGKVCLPTTIFQGTC